MGPYVGRISVKGLLHLGDQGENVYFCEESMTIFILMFKGMLSSNRSRYISSKVRNQSPRWTPFMTEIEIINNSISNCNIWMIFISRSMFSSVGNPIIMLLYHLVVILKM